MALHYTATEPFPWSLLVLVLGSALALRLWALRRVDKGTSNRPFVMQSWAPFGIDLAFTTIRTMLHHQFVRFVGSCLQKHNTVEVCMMGNTMIWTKDLRNVKALMSSQFSEFSKGAILTRILGNLMGDAIFVSEGESWHEKKELLRPHFSVPRESDLPFTEQHFQHLMRHLEGGKAVDVYDLIDRYQLDVVSHVFFGKSSGCLLAEQQPFREAMDWVLKTVTLKAIFGYLGSLVPDAVLAARSLQHIDDYIGSLYSQAQSAAPGDEGTLLDSLAAKRLDFKGFKGQVISVMLAAKDPAAIAATSGIYELAKHPDVFQKVKAELEQCVGDSPPTADQLKELKYLTNVVNETIRLWHPLGINVRAAKVDTTIPAGGGPDENEPVAVSKGTHVIFSVIELQRDKRIWGEAADSFRPERWDERPVDRWSFIPFNHGPRICLGRNFGRQQVAYAIARLCHEFKEIRLVGDSENRRVKIELNTKMADPIVCRFIR